MTPCGRRRATRRSMSVNLVLVVPQRMYRPAPDLSRPELRAAYDRGRAERAACRREPPPEVLALRGEARRAYLVGLTDEVLPPAPLAVELALIAEYALVVPAAYRRTGRRRLVALAAVAANGLVIERLRVRLAPRRAHAMGLTPETAPIPCVSWSRAMQLAAASGYRAWRFRRGTSRPLPPASVAASEAVRVIMLRRAWRAARRSPAL